MLRVPGRVCGTSPHHFGITRPRRYPVQQAQYSCVLPTLCQNGGHRKRVLSRGHSRVVCRPSTVRIAPPGSNLAHFPIAAQIPKAPDPWSKEAVLLALERWKRKKRTVEEEEDQTSAAAQEEKRRCHDSSGSGHSAFKPEVANGVPAAFVPEPGPLKRGLSSQSSDGELRKRTCSSAVSCSKGTCTCGIRMSSRNAITSSYTSTGGISQLWKRRPSASPFSSPASSHSQTPESPEKKMREEDGSQGSGSSTPLVNKESQGEQDTTTCREQNWDSPPTPSSSQPHRRKFPLVPSRRGIPLISPPAPWIGRSITVEEHYQEKQAQSQWLKRIFEDKTVLPSHGLHSPVWQALATPAPTTAITFSQSLPSAIQSAAGSSTASFGGFSGTLTTSAPIALSQPALTFSSTTTPAFNIPFSSGTRAPIPSYPGVMPQHTFGATDRQQMWTASQHWSPALAAPFLLEAQQPWSHPSQPLAALCSQVFVG
ncbi:Nuclear envelope pore membrane protein POM 121 [Manis javanica]|nr:Nuclear envelope pore membrane protein POM 121 [Manis javanica]